MKQSFLLKTIISLVLSMLVTIPSVGGTRKAKKAAKIAAIEQDAQLKREEKALEHQLKMDSLKNAQKAALAKAKKNEQDALAKEVKVEEMPCVGEEFYSTEDVLRATGVGESMQQQMSKKMARSTAVEELTGKINTAVQSLVHDYYKSENKNGNEDYESKYQGLTVSKVDQKIGYRTICEQYTTYYTTKGQRRYKCYMAIEVGRDEILKPLYDGIQGNEQTKIDYDYSKFKEEFQKAFSAE